MSVIDPLKAKTFGLKPRIEDEKKEYGAASNVKRASPTGVKPAVDEWIIMEQQKQRAAEALASQQREEDRALKKVYNEQLADIQKVKEIERKQDLLQKELESQDIKASQFEYMAAVKKLREEDKEFKRFIRDNYSNHVSEAKERENLEREQKLAEEKRQLEIIKMQIQEEKRQKAEQKLLMKQEMEDMIKRKEEARFFEKKIASMGRDEENALMDARAKREVEKEHQYKAFFKDYDDLMQNRIKSHVDSVSVSQVRKDRRLQDWISKNEEEYKAKLEEKERQLNEWRKRNNLQTYDQVRVQMENKEKEKDSYKKSYQERALENLSLVEANREYNSKLAQEKAEQQKAYRELLGAQQKIKEELSAKYGTMTETERRMNSMDLSAFKEKASSVAAMIPGISSIPSVGSKPTCRGGRAIVMNSPFSPISGKAAGITGGSFTTQDRKMSKPTSPVGSGYTYNPITNPIPNYMQNPYILRQKQAAFSARNLS